MVRSDGDTPATLIAEAQALGLKSVSKVTFSSMSRTSDADGGASQLGAFKAVPKGYPLRGSLTDSEGAQASAGEVMWASKRFRRLHRAQPGSMQVRTPHFQP